MVQQEVREGCLSFRSVKRAQVDACISEGLVGWCEDGERARSLECGQEICLNHCSHKRIVNAGCLSRCRNVHGRHQNSVNHMDNTVRCEDICCRDGCCANGHRGAAHAKLDLVAIDHGGKHAIGNGACRNFSRHHVVEKNVAQGFVFFRCVEICKIDASISESLVGWSEDSEGACALEGGDQACMSECCHERVVNAGSGCIRWNILGFIRTGIQR